MASHQDGMPGLSGHPDCDHTIVQHVQRKLQWSKLEWLLQESSAWQSSSQEAAHWSCQKIPAAIG